MKAIEISEVSALAPHVQPGCSEPLLLTDQGRVVATVVPADEDDWPTMLLSINPTVSARFWSGRGAGWNRREDCQATKCGSVWDSLRNRVYQPAVPGVGRKGTTVKVKVMASGRSNPSQRNWPCGNDRTSHRPQVTSFTAMAAKP